jgi:hypothetical protein
MRWTDETDRQAAELFDTLELAELRRRQDLCHLQLERAYTARDEQAMLNLQRMDQALTDAVLRRTAVPA